MTVEQRYARAARSSNLKLDDIAPRDVDVVIAAGFSERLGTMLLRCRNEWAAQRAEFDRMFAVLNTDRAAAAVAKKQAISEGERTKAAPDFKAAEKITEDSKRALATSRALALMAMQSLGAAAAMFHEAAGARSHRLGLRLSTPEIADCVGNGLDLWLDQRCAHCAGRGFNGGYGVPVVVCRGRAGCGGTGKKRRDYPSRVRAQIALGEWVVAEADRMAERAQRRMHRVLR